MNWKRIISRGISELYALKNKFKGPRSGLRILMYHSIKSEPMNDLLDIYTVPLQLFKSHIKTLIESPSLSLISITEGLHSISPIAKQSRLPLTMDIKIIFISSEPVKAGKTEFLTPSEIRELSQFPGVNIGTHGATHTPLTELKSIFLQYDYSSK